MESETLTEVLKNLTDSQSRAASAEFPGAATVSEFGARSGHVESRSSLSRARLRFSKPSI